MDTVANMLTSVINAQRVGKERVVVPHSKFNEQLLTFLQEQGRVASLRTQGEGKAKIVVTLAEPGVRGVRRVSKPGARQYAAAGEMPYPKHGGAFFVVSTSKGLMDERKPRREGVGGELICEIW